MTVDLAKPRFRSYTALSTYMECPRQYRVKYVDRVPEEPSVWSVGGTAFHQCAEWILTGELPLDELTSEGIANGWDDAWREAYLEVVERNPDINPDMGTWRAANGGRETPAWWHKHGPEMVERFIRWRQTTGRDLRVIDQGVEHRFEVDLGGVPVVAIPDALVVDEHDQVNILDWKSGRRAPSGALQLAVYRTAVLHGWGMNPVWGHFYLTRKAVLIPYDLTAWTPEYVAGLFQEFDSRERAGDYTPTPGDHCKFCIATREHCPYGKENE